MNIKVRKLVSITVVLVAVVGAVFGWQYWEAKQLLELCHADMIARFDGPLANGRAPAAVRIYACEKQSTSTRLTDIRQNVIEITLQDNRVLKL